MRIFEISNENKKFDYSIDDINAIPLDNIVKKDPPVNKLDEPLIGPHEGKILNLMLAGMKPAAFVDAEEYNIGFKPYVQQGRLIKVRAMKHKGKITQYVVTLPGEEWRGEKLIKLFPQLWQAVKDKSPRTIRILDIKIGKLLGYPKEAIRYFDKTRNK